MKFTTLCVSLLMSGLFSLATGCAPQPPAETGSSPREIELTKTVTELREKLAAAEREIQEIKTAAAQPQPSSQSTTGSTHQEKPAGVRAPQPETKVVDTSYIVVKKTFIAGKLIAKRTSSNPNATERQPASCRITFKGVPSGKEYPELEVKELAFSQFREGIAYSAQDITQAKKSPSLTEGKSSGTAASGGTVLSEAEARAIFGD
jgi:hypothetical protein